MCEVGCTLITLYLRLQGVILVYDVTNEKSFASIRAWMKAIDQHASDDVERMIIGNKCDQNDQRSVTFEQGQQVLNVECFT